MENARSMRALWLAGLLMACAGCGGSADTATNGSAQAAVGSGAAPDATPLPPPADAPAGRAAADTDSAPVTFLAAAHDVQIFARVNGIITHLDVEEGSRLAAGGRLAQIEDDSQRLALQEREADLASASSTYDRAVKLHDTNVLADQQLTDARAAFEIARARRDRATLDLEHCAVRTPISGVVSMRVVQVGQMVKEGDLLFRVSDPDTLRAELLLPEEWLGDVRVGQAVTLEPRIGGRSARARVTRVNSMVDPASGTFRVIIDLDNRAVRLPSGISVRCRFDPMQSVQRRR